MQSNNYLLAQLSPVAKNHHLHRCFSSKLKSRPSLFLEDPLGVHALVVVALREANGEGRLDSVGFKTMD